MYVAACKQPGGAGGVCVGLIGSPDPLSESQLPPPFLSGEALSVKISVAEANPHPALYFPGCLAS